MSSADLIVLSPLMALTGTAVLVMLGIAVRRNSALACALTVAGLIVTLITLPFAAVLTPRQVTPLFTMDDYTLFFTGLFSCGALFTALLSNGYFRDMVVRREELYLLLVIATLGGSALAASTHLASLFLALETISIALYALIGYRLDGRPMEASFKYLVLVGVASGFLAFGLGLLYAGSGTMEFAAIGELLRTGATPDHLLLLAGVMLVMVGLGFKLSLVPFHLWTPDVYQGAPAPVTGFLATVSKGAVFAVLLRLFVTTDLYKQAPVVAAVTGIAVVTILAGNWLALLEKNVKRLLAYSSIGHIGYLLVPLLAGDELGIEAVTFYFVAYFLMTLGAFGAVAALSLDDGPELEILNDYRGLFWHRPWLAGVMSLMLLALAGIPLTAGFISKFYAVAAGVSRELWFPVIVLVIGSAIGLFYYLRVIITMARPAAGEAGGAHARAPARRTVPWTMAVALALVTAGLIVFGIYPQPVMSLLAPAAGALS